MGQPAGTAVEVEDRDALRIGTMQAARGRPHVDEHWWPYALNPTEAWVPSQKGLLLEAPQRHSVRRLRTSYVVPSADSTGMPPLTQMGPLTPICGSSTSPIEGSKA